MTNGYVRMMINGVTKLEHQWVAEKALGKPLPAQAEVHHVDLTRTNNAPTNLVICQDAEYHDLLHQRTNALSVTGHAHWRKCRFCERHDAPDNLYISKTNVHHRECMNAYYRNKRKAA